MDERTVHTYDPPASGLPDTARYTAAMTFRASREAKALRLRRWYAGLTVASLTWGGLMTWDNQRLAAKLVEVARHKPVYRVDQDLAGHQQLVLLDDVLTVTKGARLNAVHWFLRWTRQIGTDPVAMAKDRAAARARLVAGAERKWDALLAADLDPAAGWSRDVTGVRIEEQQADPTTQLSAFHVVWTETVYKAFRPERRELMSAAVVTLDGPSREGALDGVSISGFSEPSATPLALEAARPPAATTAPRVAPAGSGPP